MDLDTTSRDPDGQVGEPMRDDELDQVSGGMYVDPNPGPRRRRARSGRDKYSKKHIFVG